MRRSELTCTFIGHGRFGARGLESLLLGGRDRVRVVSVFQDLRSFSSFACDDPTAVAAVAERFDIPVFFDDLVASGYTAHLARVQPDYGLVMRYPKKLPREITELTRLGFFNLHASDLPKYRGVAPLEYTIVHEDEICLSVHQITERFDEGDLLLKSRRVPIGGMPIEAVFEVTTVLGAETALETAARIAANNLDMERQDPTKGSTATRRGLAALLRLDFEADGCEALYRKILARGAGQTRLSFALDRAGRFDDVAIQVSGFQASNCSAPREAAGTVIPLGDGTFGLVAKDGIVDFGVAASELPRARSEERVS